MKQLALFSFLFISLKSITQENNTGIPIPMKNGIIFYEKTFIVSQSISKDKLFSLAESWFKTSFPGSKDKISIDKDHNQVSSKGLFKIITDEKAGHYYWIKPAINIIIKEDSCKIEIFNYYEKPIMPGVTNDYSKIEYRWWDYRRGKPWSKEDQALFNGLDQQSVSLLTLFKKELDLL
jgi:hypothetical protein